VDAPAQGVQLEVMMSHAKIKAILVVRLKSSQL
jgi:hypothetical protein